jgi:hypothetical protein
MEAAVIIADTDSGRSYVVDPADLDMQQLLALADDPDVLAEIRRRVADDTTDTLPPGKR